MSRLKLVSFDPPATDAGAAEGDDPTALEDTRLAAFETGYKAGWDDAVAAESAEQDRIRADLARNLQAMSFSYHEARGAILAALEPLLREIVARVLPELARETLAHSIAERLLPHAAAAADMPVELVCNPANRAAIAAALGDQDHLRLAIVTEPTLGDGQVYLRFGETEERIDLNAVIATLAEAVAAFFATETDNRKASAHG